MEVKIANTTVKKSAPSAATPYKKKYADLSFNEKVDVLHMSQRLHRPYASLTPDYLTSSSIRIDGALRKLLGKAAKVPSNASAMADVIQFNIGSRYKPSLRGATLAFKKALSKPFKNLTQISGGYFFDFRPLGTADCLAVASNFRGNPEALSLYTQLCLEAEKLEDEKYAKKRLKKEKKQLKPARSGRPVNISSLTGGAFSGETPRPARVTPGLINRIEDDMIRQAWNSTAFGHIWATTRTTTEAPPHPVPSAPPEPLTFDWSEWGVHMG